MVTLSMASRDRQRGVSLIEVLIAMVILAIGLLGLIGLQGRLHVTQVESYQRAQALILLQDMANRIALNRNQAAAYVTDVEPIGTGMAGGACPIENVTRVERDVREWCQFLIGASETLGGDAVGGMIGGRGCIDEIAADEYLITVAWQGMAPSVAPPESPNPDIEPCGGGEYDGPAGSPCVNDLCRRVVTTVVRISDLTP
jgi:type IV pilus assembly protein PilV